MSNYKYHGIKDAKKQFIQDLQQDDDYIEYKKRCMMDNYMSYGCVTANLNVYLLNEVGPTSESLIANYLKSETKTIKKK